MTYKDLLEKLSALTPTQLNDEVIWATEGFGGTLLEVEVFAEDQTMVSGDGIEPISTYAYDPAELAAAKEEVVWRAGQIMLLCEVK